MKDIETPSEDFESFLYIITHDLKTFSRAMRVIPEWIEEDLQDAGLSLPRDVAEHVTMLKSYANGMDLMLDGLTEMSRVGRLADPPAPHVIRDVLEENWSRVAGRENFIFDIANASGTVVAPANDLDRLIFALLSNAVRHHHTGHGRVDVRTTQIGDRLTLIICDDGPGIDPEFRERIFEPLYTLRPKDESGTAGVGLAVARKVVHSLEGTISTDAVPNGTGCIFECDLPLATA